MNLLMEYILRVLIPVHQLTTNMSTHRFITGDESETKDNNGKCELVGTFSLVTQACLGLLCMSSLIVKRHYEWPVRRTWAVWFFDVSKQLLGALGVHVFNVVLSIIKTLAGDKGGATGTSEDGDDGGWDDEDLNDPCNWYFLNIVFDCTIGVYILYLVFSVANRICKNWFHITNIKSGEYGDPNRPSITAYLKQLAIYYVSLMITKVILFVVMNYFALQLLWITDHILLVWLNNYPEQVEIFMVIFVIPIIMNCLQFILVDNIIQNPYFRMKNKEQGPSESDSLLSNTSDNSTSASTITNNTNTPTNNNNNNSNYGTFDV